MKIYLVIAESKGTDDTFCSEVELCKTKEGANKLASELIADMAETMSVYGINPEQDRNIEKDTWFYRIKIEEREL